MRPLETEHKGWRIRVIAHPVGRAWSALVEVWEPEAAETAEARIVPFHQTLPSEKPRPSGGSTGGMGAPRPDRRPHG